MTAAADLDEPPAKGSSKFPLLIGLVLLLAGAGGGFMAVDLGLLGGGAKDDGAHSATGESSGDHAEKETVSAAFVPLDPLIISLPGQGGQRFLRFTAQIETAAGYEAEVTAIKPRIVDVLNGYLRAVDLAEMQDPTALVRLRGQMLRRVQVVAGEGRVRDLLIMEFVVN